MNLILDTNGYVGFKLGHAGLVDYLSQANLIFISPIVLGELLFGFRNGSQRERNMKELDQFLSHEAVEVIQLTDIYADRYSRIAA
jgi:tRNA(fMet)-specific endonuclease VapC